MSETVEPTVMDELVEAFVPESFNPEFKVTDESSANWVVDKILSARERQKRITAQYEKMLADARREEEFFYSFYRAQLEDYARKNLAGNAKNVKLLHGTLEFRKNPAKLDIYDETTASAWAMQHEHEALRVSATRDGDAALKLLRILQQNDEKPDITLLKPPLKKHVKDGESVPGCRLIEGDETFQVK